MAEDDPVVAARVVDQVAILRLQVSGLIGVCERQSALITQLLAHVRRIDEQVQLELVALQPSPPDPRA